MRAPADHDMSVFQQKSSPLVLPDWVERQGAAISIGGRTHHGALNDNGAAEFLGQARDIQGMQVLHDIAADQRLRHHIQRAGGNIYHRRAGDSHFRHEIAATEIGETVGSSAAGRYQTNLRVDTTRVSVDGVHTVMFGGDMDNIMRSPTDREIREIQGLRINSPIHRSGKQLAELRAVDVRWGENRLLRILAGAGVIVMVSRDVDLSVERTSN